jgi:hypothetical protein
MINIVTDGRVYVYLDDITVTGPIDQVTRALAIRKACFESLGLTINNDKSVMYAQGEVTYDVKQNTEGIEIPGTPIGSPSFIEAYVRKKLQQLKEKLSKLKNISSLQDQYLLLKFSFRHMSTHLYRTVPQMFDEGGLGSNSRQLIRRELSADTG